MADNNGKKDFSKLRAFVEAALTNAQHPVYQAGMQRSPILQHYAINVMTLQSVKPEDWFAQYPQHVAKLEAVMAECERQSTGEPAPAQPPATPVAESAEVKALKDTVAALEARLARLEQPPAAPPAGEPADSAE